MVASTGMVGVASAVDCRQLRPAHCGLPPQVGTALFAAFAIGVVGLVVTVIQLYRRKPGWPFAVATFALCALAIVLGGVGYAMAVG